MIGTAAPGAPVPGSPSSLLVVLPARIGSTRLPEKALADIHGAPMVVRTWEAAVRADVGRVVVATDDVRIATAVGAAGGEAVMTGVCASGTDRVAEAARTLGWTGGVLNVQGDEPLIDPDTIRAVAAAVHAGHAIATAATPLDGDPVPRARVKVVLRDDRSALYFSRAPIPVDGPWLQHLGVYGFAAATLQQVAALPPSLLERAESLEQLRWLEAGHAIHVAAASHARPAVDTPEDLERVRALWRPR